LSPVPHPGLVVALGALLALDDAACVSLLFCEPLFAAALAGAVYGCFGAAVPVGATLQFLSIVSLRVGGAKPPDGGLAALAAVAALPPGQQFTGSEWLGDGAVAVPVLVGVAFGYAGRAARDATRALVGRLVRPALAAAARGDASRIAPTHAASIAVHALRGAAAAAIASVAAPRLAAALAPTAGHVPAGFVAMSLGAVVLVRATPSRARWQWVLGAGLGLIWAVS